MGFEVANVRAVVDDLRKQGVVFEEYDTPALKTIHGVVEMPGRISAWFKDTEGNV
jgi:hypothetical protein